jgi:hypothetical protein
MGSRFSRNRRILEKMFETQKHRSSSNIVEVLNEIQIQVDSGSTKASTSLKNPFYEDQTS